MEQNDPALFHTGVAAQAYSLLRGTGTVTRVFRATGGPADEGDTDIVLLLRRADAEAPPS